MQGVPLVPAPGPGPVTSCGTPDGGLVGAPVPPAARPAAQQSDLEATP